MTRGQAARLFGDIWTYIGYYGTASEAIDYFGINENDDWENALFLAYGVVTIDGHYFVLTEGATNYKFLVIQKHGAAVLHAGIKIGTITFKQMYEGYLGKSSWEKMFITHIPAECIPYMDITAFAKERYSIVQSDGYFFKVE